MRLNDSCFEVKPGGKVTGHIRVPGDKSISHRALILGAISEGQTTISGFLKGADTLATATAFRQMGVDINIQDHAVVINGVGLQGLQAPNRPLDFGNSGTALRLMTGLLAAQSFDSELTGDHSLAQRPMNRVIEPLLKMGAKIECTAQGTLPIKIYGGQHLHAIHYSLPIASAQLKSCLLLAGLYADGTTTMIEPQTSRDHTERLLRAFAHPVTRNDQQISITRATRLRGTKIIVPADFSSAAFFIVAATIAAGSDLILENVGINPSRNAMLTIMKLMGADITLQDEREQAGEPVATIRVKSSPLQGINIPENLVPIAIDEFPAILIAAACAKGKTKLSGAAELRVKESDRIAAMCRGFAATGITTEAYEDGLVLDGGQFQGGVVESDGDHRIAMAFAIAGMVADKPIVIRDCDNVATSFPNFVELASQAGINIACTSHV